MARSSSRPRFNNDLSLNVVEIRDARSRSARCAPDRAVWRGMVQRSESGTNESNRPPPVSELTELSAAKRPFVACARLTTQMFEMRSAHSTLDRSGRVSSWIQLQCKDAHRLSCFSWESLPARLPVGSLTTQSSFPEANYR
jgi:hypothetical protein